jgi:hypothetical protein
MENSLFAKEGLKFFIQTDDFNKVPLTFPCSNVYILLVFQVFVTLAVVTFPPKAIT